MRLICGIVRLDGTDAAEADVRAMAAHMCNAARKPAIALWSEGPAALAVLDFAPGADVTLVQTGDAVLAADVRLDLPVLDAGDDRHLASVLAQSGAQGIAGLVGDFAFASWDRKTQTLTCGRDALGTRPFNYHHVPRRVFAFASLPAAIHEAGVAPRRLSERALALSMARHRQDISLLEDIHRLRPAHLLTVSTAGLRTQRYWQVDRATLGRCEDTPEQAAATLRALLEQAVHARLRDRSAVGAHLSGGLDSSAITVIAARALRGEGRRLHAYSLLDRLRNDITLPDETPFVREVLDQEGDIVWTPVRPRPQESLPSLDAESSFGPHDMPEEQICSDAEERGIQLLLTGFGGDDSASYDGRGALAEALVRGHWQTFKRMLPGLARVTRKRRRALLYTEVFIYVAPRWLGRFARTLTRRGRSPMAHERQEEFQGARMRALLTGIKHDRVMNWDARRNRLNLIEGEHIPAGLEKWARDGARHGLAYTHPMLDRRLIEYAMTLPSAYFVKEGVARAVFRDAMEGILPEAVRHRTSKFIPFPTMMFDRADLKPHLLARLDALEASDAAHGWLDFARVREAIAAFPDHDQLRAEMTGNKNPASTHRGLAAMTRVVLTEQLLERAVDRT